MQNAIYYEGMYMLLPDNFSDYDAFIQDLQTSPLPAQYHMVVLREDYNARNHAIIKGRSITPYFLSGYHDSPSPVTITNPDKVYPTHVEILDQTEYNSRLREIINKVCPGCQRFKPLSNRVQSLNSHFDEISLDGVCLFRQESKPSPRSFHNNLYSFGGFFKRFHYEEQDSREMQHNLKQWFYVSYSSAILDEEYGQKSLTLCCKKNEFLTPILTDAISQYTNHISYHTYNICLSDNFACTQKYLDDVLSPKNAETFRKECKKYGVSIAILEYDQAATEIVRNSLRELVDRFWMFPLLQTNGKTHYLVADTARVLKELRYRTPLLQAHNTTIDIYDQYTNSHYEISFDMKKTVLE